VSVLVEALSVVVRRLTLDVSYPGGTDAYLARAANPCWKARFAIADEALTCVSFLVPEPVVAWLVPLAEHGLIGVDDGELVDVATVDQRFGPTMPCDWLAVERGTDGVTRAWLASVPRGPLVVPNRWSPAISRRLVRSDDRDVPGRMLPLAVEETGRGAIETWLDFTTGQVTSALSQRVPLSAVRPPAPFPDPIMLLHVARVALDDRGFLYDVIPDDTLLRFRVQGRSAAYYGAIRTDEEWEQAAVLVTAPVFIPEPARVRVSELFTRANFGLRIGCFEFDMDDGEWRFRVSVDVEGGELTARMVNLMLSAALAAMDDYHEPTLRVAYGDVSPAQAYADAQDERRARVLAARCEATDETTDGSLPAEEEA
jgi:hypothetical protein